MDDDALREKLFNLLQRSGIKNTVKAKLRTELIGLFSKQIRNRAFSELSTGQKDLINKVTDQLIAEHLDGQGFEYSKSVFTTEAGIDREQRIDVNDFFSITDSTHRKLMTSGNLSQIVRHLINSKSVSLSKTTASDEQTQTSMELLSYNEKLALVEQRKS